MNESYVPRDVIYNIYFYTNDYCTANNFWLLSKEFNLNYMKKYNKAYKHKFMLLFNDIFTFLSLLPTPTKYVVRQDIDFFELITVRIADQNDKKMLRNDIYFIYRIIKNFFIYYLTSDHIDSFYFNISRNISYATMLQGTQFLLDNIDIMFNKRYIRIVNKYNKNIFLEKLLKSINYNQNYNQNYNEKLCLQIKVMCKES